MQRKLGLNHTNLKPRRALFICRPCLPSLKGRTPSGNLVWSRQLLFFSLLLSSICEVDVKRSLVGNDHTFQTNPFSLVKCLSHTCGFPISLALREPLVPRGP